MPTLGWCMPSQEIEAMPLSSMWHKINNQEVWGHAIVIIDAIWLSDIISFCMALITYVCLLSTKLISLSSQSNIHLSNSCKYEAAPSQLVVYTSGLATKIRQF